MNKWAALLVVFPTVFLALLLAQVTGMPTWPSFLIAAVAWAAVCTAIAVRRGDAQGLWGITAITMVSLTVLGVLIWLGRSLSDAGLPTVVAWAVPIVVAAGLVTALVRWGVPLLRRLADR